MTDIEVVTAFLQAQADRELSLELSRQEVARGQGTERNLIRICGLSGEATIPLCDRNPQQIEQTQKAALHAAVACDGFLMLIATSAISIAGEVDKPRVVEALRKGQPLGAGLESEAGIVVYGSSAWGRLAVLLRPGGERVNVSENIDDNSQVFGWVRNFWEKVDAEIGNTSGDGAQGVHGALGVLLAEAADIKRGTLH